MVENHFDHGFTISKKSVCFLFALFLSFFPSPNASANGQQRQISLAKPTRKGGAIKFHVEVVEKLPAVLFFFGEADIFCGARNPCSLLKDWFCQFPFGGDCFYVSVRGISQNDWAFIYLSVFFLRSNTGQRPHKKPRRSIMNRLGVTNLTNQGVSWTL